MSDEKDSNNECTKIDFNKLVGITLHELKQKDTETLINYVIEMKEILSGNKTVTCACGQKDYHAFNVYDNCHNCPYGICSNCSKFMCASEECSKKCNVCQNVCCINCIKYCVSCINKICNSCIHAYPEWPITGCKTIMHYYRMGKKEGPVILYHCIFPATNKNEIAYYRQTPYCSRTSYFGNICDKHFAETDIIITNVLDKLLPTALIFLCIEYFYVKMSDSNWNCREMKNIRDSEIKNYYNKLHNVRSNNCIEHTSDSNENNNNNDIVIMK
jgi:hypothetical protein